MIHMQETNTAVTQLWRGLPNEHSGTGNGSGRRDAGAG
jgi:hypothetical protein